MNMAMQKYSILVFVFSLLFIPQILFAVVVPAGTLENSIWFSKDPFFAGEHITINTLLYNSSEYTLEGVLVLYDGTSTIGTRNFAIGNDGASTIISIPWTVTRGEHSFSSVISNSFLTKGNIRVSDTILNTNTKELKRYADVHTEDQHIPDVKGREILTLNNKTKSISTPLKLPDELPEKIVAHIPDPILNDTLPVISGAESYRMNSYTHIEKGVNDTVREIIARKNASTTKYANTHPSGWEIIRSATLTGDVLHSPFAYAKLFFLLVGQFIVTNVYIFYIFLLFCIYVLLRIIWSMIP